MSRRVFNMLVVLGVAIPFGVAMATLRLPLLLSFALGLVFGAITYRVADDWWESQH